MTKERLDHLPVVLFTKENMNADKPFLVVNIPPVRFIGGPISQGIIDRIQVSWYPKIFVAVITTVGVTVEEALDDIVIKAIKVAINMECGGEASWVKSLVSYVIN